jgi:hypothetical protein
VSPAPHFSSRAPFATRFTQWLHKLSNQTMPARSCGNPFRINTYKISRMC